MKRKVKKFAKENERKTVLLDDDGGFSSWQRFYRPYRPYYNYYANAAPKVSAVKVEEASKDDGEEEDSKPIAVSSRRFGGGYTKPLRDRYYGYRYRMNECL